MPDFTNATVQTPLREGGRKLGREQTVDQMVLRRVLWEYEKRMVREAIQSQERRRAEGLQALLALTPLPPVGKGHANG